MTRHPSFAKTEYFKLLRATGLSVVVWFGMLVADTIVTGNLVGADGISGISVVIPFTTVAAFLATLVACGTAILFSRLQGAFDRDRAARVTGTGFTTTAVLGVVLYAVLTAVRDVYFDSLGLSAAVRAQAEAYWRWESVLIAVMPMEYLVEHLVCADGDDSASILSSLVNFALNITLSIAFTRWMGNAGGAALGTLVALLADTAIEASHFLKKTNSVSLRPRFSLADLKKIAAFGIVDATPYVLWAAALAILNSFVLSLPSGEAYLPVVLIAFQALEFSVIFDGLGEAYKPVGGMYAGEGNMSALAPLTSFYFRLALVVGCVTGAAFFLARPLIPVLYDLQDPKVVAACTTMVTYLAIAMPFMSVLMMTTSQFLVMGRVALPIGITVVKDFFAITALPVASGAVFGLDAMWIGFPAGFALSLGLSVLAVRVFHAKDFPWLVPPDDNATRNISVVVDENAVVAARETLGDFLRSRGVDGDTIYTVMLIVEETMMLVHERNGARRVVAEASATVRDGAVRLVMRDTGEIMDVTSGDAQSDSFRAMFLASMMREQENRSYLMTLSCNRSEYLIRTAAPIPPPPTASCPRS